MFLNELPKNEDYDRILQKFPELMLKFTEKTFSRYYTDIWDYIFAQEVRDWVFILEKRIYKIRFGFVLMEHLYELGIPDEDWYDRKTGSLYPHFTKEHHLRKMMFDYFSESIMSNIFSAFETIGQIIFKYYDLKITNKDRVRKISFDNAVNKLEGYNCELYRVLHGIRKSYLYNDFKELRNDATHNYPASNIGPTTERHSSGVITYGLGGYTPSAEIREAILNSVSCLNVVIEAFETYKECVIVPEDK